MQLGLILFVAAAAVVYLAASSSGSSDDVAAVDTETPDAARADAGSGDGLFAAMGHVVADVKKLWTPPAAAEPYLPAMQTAAAKYGLPADLLPRQAQIESGYAPDVIDGTRPSSAGAVGLLQFMPRTAAGFSIDPTDPYQSIEAAAKYLRQLFDQFGSWPRALAAYNWGPGNLNKYLAGTVKTLPIETSSYVDKILGPLGLDTEV